MVEFLFIKRRRLYLGKFSSIGSRSVCGGAVAMVKTIETSVDPSVISLRGKKSSTDKQDGIKRR